MAKAMKQLGSLFETYKTRFKPPQASVEAEVVEVVKEVLGFQLRPEQVSYTTGSRVVSLLVPSVIRTEVIKQKAVVITALVQRMGITNAPKDIR